MAKPVKDDRTVPQIKLALRKQVKMFYDIQRLRLQASGRILKKHPDAQVQLFESDKVLLEGRVEELKKLEKSYLHDIESTLKCIPFYNDVLSDKVAYKGVGPTMAGVILSEFDIHRADTASDFWSYAGLAPQNCKRCKACSTIVEEVEDPTEPGLSNVLVYQHSMKTKCEKSFLHEEDVFSSGKTVKPTRGVKLKYNSFLRSKLCGVLGPVILQAVSYRCPMCDVKVKKNIEKVEGKEDVVFFTHPAEPDCAMTVRISAEEVKKDQSPWTKHYYDYKHRKETAGWGTSDQHRNAASIRYMIKMLLLDIWTKWREHEGLVVRPSYHQEKQGGHVASPEKTVLPPVDPDLMHKLELEAELALADD